MHTINHPKLRVLADIAELMVRREGIEPSLSNVGDFVHDDLKDILVWGVYPEIASARGIRGCYAFQRGHGRVWSLREFIEGSFACYARHPREALHSTRFDEGRFERLLATSSAADLSLDSEPKSDRQNSEAENTHPYSELPASRFWRRSIVGVPFADVDPVERGAFMVQPETKIATAGSCFAQHISAALATREYGYYIAETPPPGIEAEAARADNYGVFSARYGNIYTARQLLQLFDRAFGRFDPWVSSWRRPDGRFVDPFRPGVEPGGFGTAERMLAQREVHFEAVRRMFGELNVLVFTLGLTEAWRSIEDGAVLPLAPGVAGGTFDPSQYEFINFSAGEVAEDLAEFVERLGGVNPTARVILTVSPVPLVATYEHRHVLTSTTYSKSALRSAAEDVRRQYDNVDYFPSYEVIVGHFNRGAYFDSDLRSVNSAGIEHVMRLFFKHYTEADAPITERVEIDPLFDVVCDEEHLDARM